MPQKIIHHVLSTYPTSRDVHSSSAQMLVPIIQLLELLVASVNASLVSTLNLKADCKNQVTKKTSVIRTYS